MTPIPTRWTMLIVMLAVTFMVGCQGFSTAKTASQGTTQSALPGALNASPANITFGNVQVGTSQTQSDTLSNTGGTGVTLTQAVVTGAGFSTTGLTLPSTLAAGQSVTFNVVFGPQALGSVAGNLAVSNDGSNTPLNIALSGTVVAAGALSTSPTSITWGNVQVGTSQGQAETLTNSGGENLTVLQATTTAAAFTYTGLSLPLTLAPNQSATFNVVFAPTTATPSNGDLSLTLSGSSTTVDIALSGTGASSTQTQGQLSVSPTTINVGNVTVGKSGTQAGTLKATGGSVVVSSIDVGSSEFTITGLTLPATIPAGQSASFTVTFTPQASGVASVGVSFASNASNSPASVTLQGSGVAATIYTVSLSWDASTSPNIVGYNIYRRSGAGGTFAKLNTVLNATTAFVDTAVTDGSTYYYETTAVNSSNEESAPSTVVQAVIPSS